MGKSSEKDPYQEGRDHCGQADAVFHGESNDVSFLYFGWRSYFQTSDVESLILLQKFPELSNEKKKKDLYQLIGRLTNMKEMRDGTKLLYLKHSDS